jgi:5,10-methylene-tetrahydrofolate dehydrogenase/methenyl tetrahydrofolate cyclohydrolase
VGIESSLVKLGADITTEEAVRAVRALSDASDVDGVLVQPPVPATSMSELSSRRSRPKRTLTASR